MLESTIKALMVLDTITVDGVKIIQIPLEDVLRGKIDIRIVPQKTDSVENSTGLHLVEAPTSSFSQSITIPSEIKQLYQHQEDKMAQDVVDYLKEISKCWEYKTLGFQQSLLKKAAKAKPALNTVICKAYGKGGDKYLTILVQDNFDYIKQCWAESNH